MQTVVLAGSPNVGKSLLFYHLTGNYVTVSNYPGTTVDVTRGRANFGGRVVEVFDTPGMYSMSPVTEEEAVSRRLLMEIKPNLIIHVVDAKNLPRMLPLTLELLSCNFQVILVLNMIDEAENLGVRINRVELSRRLGIPVVTTAIIQERGLANLKREIIQALQIKTCMDTCKVPASREQKEIAVCFKGSYPLPAEIIGRLFLEQDGEIAALIKKSEDAETRAKCKEIAMTVMDRRLALDFALQRRNYANKLLNGVFFTGNEQGHGGWLDRLTLNRYGGLLIMLCVLYFGLYLIVGRIGAGVMVDLIEGILFGEILNPFINQLVELYVPWIPVRELLAMDYGIFTLGFRYAFGVIMPIVGTFFFMFSILEDSGYLPRLAFLADNWMRSLGLNGRAVIPLTLGFGCGTMAVLVTRTLEKRRERLIATFLLALAVPCSAQLGLMIAVLSAEPYYLFIWICVVGGMFLFSGNMLNTMLPGSRSPFFMEVPPLRMPKLNAIFQKTLARMRWYFLEVIPIFVLVSIVLWILRISGCFDLLIVGLAPVLAKVGLPPVLSMTFIMGFFRRDYGAAGLFDLYRAGIVSGGQLLIAAVVLTLFLPCLPQLSMMIKERGLPAALIITFCVSVLAFLTGIGLRIVLGMPILS